MLGLFGLKTLTKDVTEIVLTSTEMDALAVYQETKAPGLALPSGFSSLPQEVLCCLVLADGLACMAGLPDGFIWLTGLCGWWPDCFTRLAGWPDWFIWLTGWLACMAVWPD